MMQVSSRERVLATIVGVVAFGLITVFVGDYFLKNRSRLQGDLARNTSSIALMKRQLSEKATWDQRDAWLQAKQPKLTSSDDVAGGQLLTQVSDLAKKSSVTIGTQAIRPPAHLADYSSISVEIETTSTWSSLIAFMLEVQGIEKFMVFETADLKIDDKDAAQMSGKFKIAKWYSPKGKGK